MSIAKHFSVDSIKFEFGILMIFYNISIMNEIPLHFLFRNICKFYIYMSHQIIK